MRIVEVKTKKEIKEFHNFPKELYKDDPCWVCPLDNSIESIFDPARNHSFRHGEAIRWILKDESDRTIGRIAAFIDLVRSNANRQATGGMGFFEVIENREAAFLLFDTAIRWNASKGIEAVDGPINFGENDNYWGLLVEGYIQPGFGMPYNKKYYRQYFEEYGFLNYFEQYSCHRAIRTEEDKIVEFPPRIMKIAEWLTKRQGFTFEHFEIKNSRKYVLDIAQIYNETWSKFKEDFTPLDPVILQEGLDQAKAFIDEELIWFAYHNGKPIGFYVLFPDLNQIIKHFNGRLNLWNMLRFVYYKATHEMTRMRALVGGVHPSYHNNGIESAIFYHLYDVFKKKPWFKELELSWVGDYNPRMIAIYKALGAEKVKTHITYRYMINKNIPFVRFKDEMAH